MIKQAIMNGRLSIPSHLLRIPAIGYVAFRVSIALKKLSLFFGEPSQRAAEYPWVLRQLENFPEGSVVLDVGCSESLLSHALVIRRLRVVGLDIRDYPLRSKQMTFVKANIVDTGLPDSFFDAIVAVSTIEHVGLTVYGQTIVDDGLDFIAIREIRRIIKPTGRIIMTTPFIGAQHSKILLDERNYGIESLEKLTKGLDVVKEDYFFPRRCHHALGWKKVSKREALRMRFTEPGVPASY